MILRGDPAIRMSQKMREHGVQLLVSIDTESVVVERLPDLPHSSVELAGYDRRLKLEARCSTKQATATQSCEEVRRRLQHPLMVS